MNDPLHTHGNQPDRHERPTRPWVCGHLAHGRPCVQGPDARGACQTRFACQPRPTEGGFECTRPDAIGGKCPSGPRPEGTCACPVTPCTPILSIRAKRRRTTINVTCASVALILIIIGSNFVDTFFSPGPLSTHHQGVGLNIRSDGTILVPDQDCSVCHGDAHSFGKFWAGGLFGSHDSRAAQNENCIHCHDMGGHPAQAHSLSADDLARRTETAASSPPGRDLLGKGIGWMKPASLEHGEISCSLCHKEHHGEQHKLTAMTDRQCQVCHQNTFHSFSKGHPDFPTMIGGRPVEFPYLRRTRLIFDHDAHFDRFEQANEKHEPAPTRCLDCHQLSDNKRDILTRPFAQSCATCHKHKGDIEGSPSEDPFMLIQLPKLDLAVLKRNNRSIGNWPQTMGSGGSQLPPFMRMLIMGASVYPTTSAQSGSPEHTNAIRQALTELLIADRRYDPGVDLDYASMGSTLQMNPDVSRAFQADLDATQSLRAGLAPLGNATEAQIDAACRIALATKWLFVEIADAEVAQESGMRHLQARLERYMGRPLLHEEYADLIGQFPLRTFIRLRDQWFLNPNS
ncbi:MAG: hypothetical protein O3C57_05400 [Verrucomicrobia bacterium]|nr:hypothetical protein [Verrucomicrobiota bacterium]